MPGNEIESVAVMRDVSGRICVLLFAGDKAVALAPLNNQLASDLHEGLGALLGLTEPMEGTDN